jgi:hypothetical protein
MKILLTIEGGKEELPEILRAINRSGITVPVVVDVRGEDVKPLTDGIVYGPEPDFVAMVNAIKGFVKKNGPGDDPEVLFSKTGRIVGDKLDLKPGEMYQTKVVSDSGSAVYTVSRHSDGVFSCTCPAWTLGNKRPCKHILKAVKSRLRNWKKVSPVVEGGWVRWVPSETDPQKLYRVEGVGRLATSCDCPDHVHRQHTCKHMRKANTQNWRTF